MSNRTPVQMRGDHRAELSRFLARSLLDLDISQACLAAHVGTTAQKVQRWTDPNCPEVPGIPDIRLFPRELARRVMVWVGEGHHVAIVDELHAAKSTEDHLANVHRLQQADSAVSSAYLSALLDRTIDPSERRDLIAKLRTSIEHEMSVLRRFEEDEKIERAMTTARRADA